MNKKEDENKKRVLFFLTRFPYPATDGTKERILNEIRLLSSDYILDVLVIDTKQIPKEDLEKIKQMVSGDIFLRKICKVRSYIQVLFSLFKNEPLQTSYYFRKDILDWLKGNCNKYTNIYFHTIRLGRYLDNIAQHNRRDNLIIGFNDAISMNYLTAQNKASGLWRFVYKIEYPRVRDYELLMLKRAKKASIISQKDKTYLLRNWQASEPGKEKPNIEVLRHCIDDEIFKYQYKPQNKNLVFMGNFFYPPNKQGLLFFIKKIMPIITENSPETKLVLIGTGSENIFQNHKAIIPMGFLAEPYDLITKQAVFINPALFGAGVSSKAITAMSLGMPVVTTLSNAQNIEGVVDGENIIFMDFGNKIKSAEIVLSILNNKDQRLKISYVAKKLALDNFLQSKNYSALKSFFAN